MTTLNNKVIELKQLNSLTQVIDQRGEYVVDITEDVILEEGDQLVMRNAFLDTSGSSSDQIKIDEDLTLTLNFVPYMMDNFSGYANTANNTTDPWTFTDDNQTGTYGPIGTVPIGGGNFINAPTGLPLYKTKVQFSNADLGYLKAVDNTFNGKKYGTNKNQFWGGGPSITLQYEDWEGNSKQFHYNIPKTFIDWSKPDRPETNGRTPRGNFLELPFHIPCKLQSVKNITSQEIMDENKLIFFGSVGGQSLDFFYETAAAADVYRQLHESSINITLKEGLYNPSDIANIITTELQTASVGEFVSSNGLLGQNDTLVSNKNMIDIANRGKNVITYASSGFEFTTPAAVAGGYVPLAYGMQSDGYWSGASQIALEYDNQANKFFWSYLHTPAYDGNGNLNVSIQNVTYDPTGMIVANKPLTTRTQIPDTTIYIKKAGGIAFTSLQPADFWSKQLGFNLDNLCITPNYIVMGEGLYNNTGTLGYPDINMLKEGITATSPRIINDINITKSTTFNKVSVKTSGQPVNTTEIYADNQVLEASISNGYWYVDITSNFSNNVITNQENYKNTVGIVSNYYNDNSYTSGNSSDSIIYTHKGQNQSLSNFRVKIMDSNRNLSSLLGNDNTVFVELVKNKSPVEQIIENEEDVMKAKEIIKMKK